MQPVYIIRRALRSRRSRDRMVVGFVTTYAICAHHHYRSEFESSSGGGYTR